MQYYVFLFLIIQHKSIQLLNVRQELLGEAVQASNAVRVALPIGSTWRAVIIALKRPVVHARETVRLRKVAHRRNIV